MEEHSKIMKKNTKSQKNSLSNTTPNPSNKVSAKDSGLLKDIIPAMNLPGDADKKMFMIALEKYEVTEKELYESFWQAYADPYVPPSGIEFRHIYKHIKSKRDQYSNEGRANAGAYNEI